MFMKTKIKLVISMFTLILCVGVISFGALAAKQATTDVSGNLTYTYDETHHILSTITTGITGVQNEKSTVISLTGKETDIYESDIRLGNAQFLDSATDGDKIQITVTITNDQELESNSPLLVKFKDVESECYNINFTKEYDVNRHGGHQELLELAHTDVVLEPQDSVTFTFTWELIHAGYDAFASFSGLDLELERLYR